MGRSLHLPQVGHRAPIPLGARVGPLLASSGIAGKNPVDGSLPEAGGAQVAHAFANLRALLAAGGGGLEHVVRLTVTLADDGLRSAVNQHWLDCFPDADDRPARHIDVQPLGHGQQVQLEVLAWIG